MHKIKLIGFFLILALPILNLPPWFSPPDWGKTIVFRVILSILIFLFIFYKRKLSIKTSLPFWLLLALFGIFLLATIFSRDPLYSFLGDPHRAGGFLNFSFYIIFAVLAFLILQKQDWQKIWDFSIFIGVLVSLIAVFWQEGRPFSTIGNPVLLALYLILLVFITLSFLLKEKWSKKKLFYLLALLLFLYVIFITGSRAAYFGLLIGFIYFVFCYPKKNRLTTLVKILFLLLLIVGAYGVYYVNTHSKLLLPRLSINLALEDPRFSAWVISLEAVKERPVLGWGPENFSIAFDKHYDPSLPFITKDWGSWYDRAHNFLFDIAVTAGIPALIIFLSLFAVLFWKLQRVKEKQPENYLICHGVQATFLAYFSTNLFSFDTFSSYLILFLLISYSLSLISQNLPEKIVKFPKNIKNLIIVPLFVGLCWFIWSINLIPLKINKEVNIALQLQNKNCQQSLAQMKKALFYHSFLDHYLGLKYGDIVGTCINVETVQNLIQVLKKNTEIRPTYTRNWLYLGIYTNFLIVKGISSVEEADYYFKKANELSPKRQEILVEWAKTYFITNDYLKAKEKAQQCVEFDPSAEECWWLYEKIK